MKAKRILLLTALALFLHSSIVQAQLTSLKTYKLTVKGTSSLHDWESNVEKLEFSGSASIEGNNLEAIDDVIVKIPVTSIKSTKGKTMDNKTWDAFKHEKHPTITFNLTSNKIVQSRNVIEASGTLIMAGVKKPIDLSLTYKILPSGALQVTGSRKLTMTDFKMAPPTAMMGTIKVGNEVEVVFDLTLNTNKNSL